MDSPAFWSFDNTFQSPLYLSNFDKNRQVSPSFFIAENGRISNTKDHRPNLSRVKSLFELDVSTIVIRSKTPYYLGQFSIDSKELGLIIQI
jgi:hypothetical protein